MHCKTLKMFGGGGCKAGVVTQVSVSRFNSVVAPCKRCCCRISAHAAFATPQGRKRCSSAAFNSSNLSRQKVAVCSSGTSGTSTAVSDEEVVERVEKASKLINTIMEDIGSELFVMHSVSHITGEEIERQEADVVRMAVSKHLEELDEGFLVALSSYIRAATTSGNTQIAATLIQIEEEVMRAVTAQLPAEMQFLDKLLKSESSEEREAFIREGVAEGKRVRLECQPTRLLFACNQLIDDMEDKDMVPDRRLLASMILLREEIQDIGMAIEFERGSSGLVPSLIVNDAGDMETVASNLAALNQNVPQKVMAFLKEIMAVGLSPARQALLERSFMESDKAGKSGGPAKTWRDAVKPGRFLTTLTAVQLGMENQPNVDKKILERIQSIRTETISVIKRIAGRE